MLTRAYLYKEALVRLVAKSMDDPHYDNLWSYYTDFNIDIKDGDYYKHQWVSLNPSFNIIGYLEAEIDRSCNCVSSVTLVNFQKSGNIIFSKDIKSFFIQLFLRYNYSKINFSVVVGSKNEEVYDRVMDKYGGRVVGIFKNHKRLRDGSLKDLKFYEIMKEDFESKVKTYHINQLEKYKKE